MTFRQNHNQLHAWKRWIESHREKLVASSLPEVIYTDENRWWRFVEHAGIDQKTGWSVDMLSPKQAEILHRLIATGFEERDAFSCLRALKGIVERESES